MADELIPHTVESVDDNGDEPADAISCFSCEACCCRLEVMLDAQDEARGIPWHFTAIDRWGGLVMQRREDGWCAAMDRNTMLCTIYERRPQICRDFEMGSDECRDERAAMGIYSPH